MATVLTAGAIGMAAGIAGSLFSAGTTVLAGGLASTAGSLAAGFSAGFVGSIASQGVASALGMQHGVDVSGALLTGLATAATAGVGHALNNVTAFQKITNTLNQHNFEQFNLATAAEMLEQNAASQAVNVAFRKHQHFDWTELGVSGITGGVLGGHLGKKVNDKLFELDHNTGILRSEFQALAGAGAQSVSTGGHFNATQVLVDNLGSAVGNAVSHVGEILSDIGTGIKETMDHLFAPHDNSAQSIEDLSFAGNLSEMDGLKRGFNNYLARQLDMSSENNLKHVIYNDSERLDGKGMFAAEVSPLRTQSLNLNEKNDFFFYGSELSEYVGNVIYNDSERLNGKGMFALNVVPLRSMRDEINIFSSLENVRSALNLKYEAKVIFSELSRHEGRQRLRAYLPMNNGNVIDNSGITIATGFDIGQHNEHEVKNFNFPKSLEDKLLPFVEATKEDAKALLSLANQTTVTAEEANLIDFRVKGSMLESTINSWNSRRLKDTPLFKNLSSAQQTVLLSRTFHQGPGMPDRAVSQNFYTAALKNDWVTAEQYLRNYHVTSKYYIRRVGQEADLLKKELR